MNDSERTRTLVEGALAVALAAALNLLGWPFPFGGKISLVMLPLLVYALRRGPEAGAVAGMVFGLVDLMIEPYLFHPVQVVLDYPLAFGAMGLVAGLFSSWWYQAAERSPGATVLPTVLATAAAVFARFVCHWVSGVVFFAGVAMGGPLQKGTTAFSGIGAFTAAALYSLVYNGTYLLVSGIATALVAALLMPALQRALPVGRQRPTDEGMATAA